MKTKHEQKKKKNEKRKQKFEIVREKPSYLFLADTLPKKLKTEYQDPKQNLQKQPLKVFYKKICSQEFRKIHRKTPFLTEHLRRLLLNLATELATEFRTHFGENLYNGIL